MVQNKERDEKLHAIDRQSKFSWQRNDVRAAFGQWVDAGSTAESVVVRDPKLSGLT